MGIDAVGERRRNELLETADLSDTGVIRKHLTDEIIWERIRF
jgi:hypothetical protein